MNTLPKAILFDLDGTLYLGERLIEGAAVSVERIRESGIRVAFLTNKPLDSPDSYATKLSRLGIPAETEDVMTSVSLTVSFLDQAGDIERVHVIGEDYLRTCIFAAGYAEATVPTETDMVVISLDREMDCSKIHFAYQAIVAGAQVVATNPDLLCPIEGGEIVDAGAWIAALEALLGREISDVMGKPSARCAEFALKHLDCSPDATLMVGDRMQTDIRMASTAGMRSALVLSGVTTGGALERFDYNPDFILDSVADLPDKLGL